HMMVRWRHIDAAVPQRFTMPAKSGPVAVDVVQDGGQEALGGADMLNDQHRRGEVRRQAADQAVEGLNATLRAADDDDPGHDHPLAFVMNRNASWRDWSHCAKCMARR